MAKAKQVPAATGVQAPPPEQIWADELAHLARWDDGARPPSWKLTPKAVVTFIVVLPARWTPSGRPWRRPFPPERVS